MYGDVLGFGVVLIFVVFDVFVEVIGLYEIDFVGYLFGVWFVWDFV